MLKIGVVGGTGRLGSLIAKAILEDSDCSLGAVAGRRGNPHIGRDISEIIGGSGKETFAYGAVKVCKWLSGQDNGFYKMSDFFSG